MTTIDSDSESQDSDDGRRFRFEATRKDDTLRAHNQNKRRSPLSKDANYRSRSMDKSSYNRRDHERTKQERDRKEANNRDRWKNSKERDISRDNKHDKVNNKDTKHGNKGSFKDSKESHESKSLTDGEKRSKDSVKNSSNSKDYKPSKDSKSKESKNSNTRVLKDTSIRELKDARVPDLKSLRDRETKTPRDIEIKDSRDRERGPKRSRDRSHEKLMTAKHGHRSREKYKGRDRSQNGEKSKLLNIEKIKEERGKNLVFKRSPGKQSERKILKRDAQSPGKIIDQIGSDSESDLGALDPDVGPVLALDMLEDCRELNLSDFDIISDTEGTSSDSPDAKSPVKGPIIKGEILEPHYYGPRARKRVSRRQYEHLVRRQAVLNKRSLAELRKVNPGHNDVATQLAPSNNNPSAISDFLLGPEASVSEVGERRRSQKRGSEMEDRELGAASTKKDINKFKVTEDQDTDKLYSLPLDKLSLSNSNDKANAALRRRLLVTEEDDKDKDTSVDSKIYGPMLPPKCQKDISDHRETVDKKLCIARELGPAPNAGCSYSLEQFPSTSLNEGVFTQSRHQNCENVKPCLLLASKGLNESMGGIIGPSLPPSFQIESGSKEPIELTVDAEPEEKFIAIIGPSLPPHLQETKSKPAPSTADDSVAPQDIVTPSRNSTFGPLLPPYLMDKVLQNGSHNTEADSEDDVFGPMPIDHSAAMNDYIQKQLEDRARRMKSKLDGKDSEVEKREEWMLELPSVQAANLGLGKRQFRSRAGPDMSDRSSWTDTPADKAKKRQDQLAGKTKIVDPASESERLAIQQRDKAMEKMAEKHVSKKRKESLVEIHKKKLHKKKKKEEKEAKEAGKPARRAFDRDIDLQANRFDEAQKKSILKKAQLLNDRFSRGESKYL